MGNTVKAGRGLSTLELRVVISSKGTTRTDTIILSASIYSITEMRIISHSRINHLLTFISHGTTALNGDVEQEKQGELFANAECIQCRTLSRKGVGIIRNTLLSGGYPVPNAY